MNNKQRVLFVVLAIVGVVLTLSINDVLAADKKPLKCEIPNMTQGAFEVPGLGYGMAMFHKPGVTSQTITVLGTKTVPGEDAEGKAIQVEMYRFDATYDNIYIFCFGHGFGHPITEFPNVPEVARKNFLVEVELVTCK